ncbi:hypothetical protein CP979_35925 [Streptomyces filamentosus]|nr:hypothetical protein CP979_35925 [Streptomyces filamentosus]
MQAGQTSDTDAPGLPFDLIMAGNRIRRRMRRRVLRLRYVGVGLAVSGLAPSHSMRYDGS